MPKRALLPLETLVLFLHRRVNALLHPRRRDGQHVVHAYAGFGTPGQAQVRCRVTLPTGVEVLPENAPRLLNAWNILRRFLTSEVSGVTVQASVGGRHASGQTNEDGYLTLELPLHSPLTPGWHQVELTTPNAPAATAPVLIVDRPEFVVVSDLDDTVIVSHASHLPLAALTMLTNNVRTRDPFPGVDELYRAMTLRDGEDNPMFYLSSSPWNLYDLLWRFLRKRGIVQGPLLLRNWRSGVIGGHGGHKLSRLRELLRLYPHLPFVLIGDSGEEDPELYTRIVHEFPQRILAVYIRDVVQSAEVKKHVKSLQDELRLHNIPLVLSPDTAGMLMHARAADHLHSAGLRTQGAGS